MKERWKGYRDKQDERGRRGAERERGGEGNWRWPSPGYF